MSKNTLEKSINRISGSPFNMVHKENKWFAAFGKYVVTPEMDTEEGIIEWINDNHWDLTTTLILLVIDSYKKNPIHEK